MHANPVAQEGLHHGLGWAHSAWQSVFLVGLREAPVLVRVSLNLLCFLLCSQVDKKARQETA